MQRCHLYFDRNQKTRTRARFPSHLPRCSKCSCHWRERWGQLLRRWRGCSCPRRVCLIFLSLSTQYYCKNSYSSSFLNVLFTSRSRVTLSVFVLWHFLFLQKFQSVFVCLRWAAFLIWELGFFFVTPFNIHDSSKTPVFLFSTRFSIHHWDLRTSMISKFHSLCMFVFY